MKKHQARGVALALLPALAGAAFAEVDVNVSSDRPTRVYVGSQPVGEAPLVVRGLQPGNHQIMLENLVTREVRTFMIPSPEGMTVERPLHLSWSAPAPAPVVYARPAPTPVVVVPAPAPAPEARAESRGKTHTRNALLGATVLSQVLTGDKRDRKRQRNVGLGAIGLNELFRK